MNKRLLSLLLALSMIFALAACSSNGTTTATTTAGTATTDTVATTTVAPIDDGTQGITDTEIKIANTAATSGAYAPVGVPFNAGIQAYLDMVNADGGIDGRKITFLHKDDEFDPIKGKAYLQEMVEDEKVFAIVGDFGTPVVAATVGDLKTYGLPVVYFATGIGQLYSEKATTNAEGYNLFPVQPIYVTEGKIMVARGVGSFDAKKIGVIYTSDDAGKDMLSGIESQCKEQKIEYVAEQVAAGAADVSAAVTSLKSANVDFVIVAAIQATMPTIVKEMAAQGMTVPAITTYVNVSPAISGQIATDIANKFEVYGDGWVSYEDDRAANLTDFQKWVAADYKENVYAQTGWIAASFFCEGLKRVAANGETLTWTSYMKAMEESPVQNPFGGTIDYSNGQRLGTQEMNMSKVTADGKWELVDGLSSISGLLKK